MSLPLFPEAEAPQKETARAYPVCDCLDKINASLPSNQQIKRALTCNLITGRMAYLGAQVQTESLGGSRKQHKEIVASYCPFCGKEYSRTPPAIEGEAPTK